MDLATTLILAVAAILGMNHMVFRLPGWEHRRVVFWGVQLLNLVVIILLLAVGIPGFASAAKAINWVLGLLLILHVVTNNGRLVAALAETEVSDSAEVRDKRERIKAALNRGAEE
jgi:hypothetical protein